MNLFDTRLSSAESTLLTHGTRLSSAESTISTHSSTLSNHGTRLNSMEARPHLQGITCRNIATGFNDDGGGNLYYLDRHNLECNDNEYLKRFYLERRGSNEIRLLGRCCRLWS